MSPPIWKQVFDAAERRVGPMLERTMNSTCVVEAAALGLAWQRRMNATAEQNLQRHLHGWNLPTGSDIKRMSQQLASLERRVPDLSKHVEELGGPNPHAHDHYWH